MLSLPHATAVVHVATPAQLRRDAPPAASRRADSRAVVGALPLQRPSHLRALRDSALCWSCSRAPLLRGSRPRRGAAVTVSALPLPAALAFGLPEVTTALLLALQVALLYVVVSGFAKQDARFNKQVARFNKQFSTLGISIGILSQLVARPRIAALFGEAFSRPLVLRSADDVVRALTPDGALRSAAEREAAVARLLRPLAEQHRAWRARFRVLLAGLQKAGVPGGATLCDADALPEAQFTAALATARRAAGEFFRRTPRKGGPPREQPLWWRAELDALQMYATAVQAGADSGATSSLLRAEFIAYLSCLLLGIRYPELEADCAGSTAVWAAGDDGASLGEIKTKSDGDLKTAADQLADRFIMFAFSHCHALGEARAMLRGNGLIFTPSLRDIAADADARAAPGTSTPAARRVDVPLFRAPGAALPAAVAVCVSFRVVLLA